MSKFKELLSNEKMQEIIRFGITGVVSTVITYAIYYLCLFWLYPNFSFIIGYIVAMVVNYFMTTSFTFKVETTTKNAVGFIISNGINYVLCAIFLNIFLWMGVLESLAPIPMYACSIPINFIIVRFVMKKYNK